jgi:hypothetical protein
MPCPSHPPWLDHSNYIWRTIQVMKLLVMQFYYFWTHVQIKLNLLDNWLIGQRLTYVFNKLIS